MCEWLNYVSLGKVTIRVHLARRLFCGKVGKRNEMKFLALLYIRNFRETYILLYSLYHHLVLAIHLKLIDNRSMISSGLLGEK